MKTGIFFALGAIAALWACGNDNDEYDASGVFETTEVTISARGAGEIMRLNIEEGQTVEAGQAVGHIDTTQLHLRKAELAAGRTTARSRLYDVERQLASLKEELATARREERRFENLVKAKAANQKQVDDIRGRIAVLEKEMAARTEMLEQGNRGAEGQLAVIAAQLAQIEDQINKCVIVSPVKGTVLSKYAEEGELAIQGSNLFKVGDLTRMYLRAFITADQLTRLKIGQQVKVYADQGQSERREYSGSVAWISDKAEFTPKTIQTRDERANLVYAVKVAVENDGLIKRGMYGEIKID